MKDRTQIAAMFAGILICSAAFTALLVVRASAHTIVLTWTPNPTAPCVNIYRGTTSGSGYGSTPINPAPVCNAATYTDATAAPGVNYYYVARAVNSSGVESADSNQASAEIAVTQSPGCACSP